MGSNSGGNCPKIMVFRPTIDEMKNFEAYINTMESVGAHKAGLAKIIPPKEWIPRQNGYDNIDLYIPSPIEQIVHGQQGLYTQYNIQKKAMHINEFKRIAETNRYKTPPHFDYEDLERKYWKNISFNPPIYGADVSGSLTDSTVDVFNINRLNTILDLVGKNYGIKIEGVNTAYLYFGMWKTTFAWHTEDMDLYSINYLHFGAPKSWYAVPPEHGKRLERLAAGFFPSGQQECSAFLRHKMTLISPQILKQYSIPFNRITQEPGEFMITFPYGYHAGFNHGFNCAESTNFATLRWIEYGKRAFKCTCRKDGVKISMDVFVRTFQPERYESWLEGKDMGCHPEDSTRFYAAPPPSKSELSFWKSEGGRMQSMGGKMEAVSKRLPFATQLEGCKRMKSKLKEEDRDTDDTEIYEPDESEGSNSVAKKLQGRKPKKFATVGTVLPVDRPSRIRKIKVKGDLPDENVKPYRRPKFSSQAKKMQKRDNKLTVQKQCDLNNPSSLCVLSVPLSDVKSQSMEGKWLSHDRWVPNEDGGPHTHTEVIPKLKIQKQGTLFHCSVFGACPSIANVNSSNSPQSCSEQNTSHSVNNQDLKLNKPKQCELVPGVSPLSTSDIHLTSQTAHLSSQISVASFSHSKVVGTKYKVECFGVASKASDSGTPQLQPGRTQGACVRKCAPHCSAMPALELVKDFSQERSLENFCVPTLHPITDDERLVDNSSICDGLGAAYSESREVCHHKGLSQDLYKQSSSSSSTLPQSSIFKKEKHKSKRMKKQLLDSQKNCKPMDAREHMSVEFVKSLGDLWQHQPPNLKAEQEFNLRSSAAEPHCSICVVFRSIKSRREDGATKNSGDEEMVPVLPSRSQVLVPASLFSAVAKDLPESSSFSSSPPRLLLPQEAALDFNPLLAPDGSAPLFRCRSCKVCIHATCYGILREEAEWLCDRCKHISSSQDCFLCYVRGGALKQTVDGFWVHVVCAILIPEVFFTNVITKDLVDLSAVTKKRKKLRCNFCWPLVKGRKAGVCVQCTSGKCSSSFHVYCGYMAGVCYEPYYGPYPVRIICHRHHRTHEKVARDLRPLRIGESVIGKQSNKRYYHCEVLQVEKRVQYSVEFDTTSYCDNVLEQDILSPLTSLVVGENVEVRWLDGLVYTCTYKGQQETCNVQVEFDDGSQATVKRDELYTKDEVLPKRVLSRLSFATERKNYLQEKSVPDEDDNDENNPTEH